MNYKYSLSALIIPFILLLSGCGGGDNKTTANLESEENGAFIKATSVSIDKPLVGIYDVTGYKISYVTTHPKTNNKIQASGLLVVPNKNAGMTSPLLSYQHGTNFVDSAIPSNNPDFIDELAGRGFIVSAADYISYGDSSSSSPTYIHAQSYVNAGLDMLRASKAFLADQGILVNDQLFLAGYSEGGYATIAIQKAIQENYSSEFNVVASSAGAGPYDVRTTAKIVASKDPNNKPAFMSYVLKSYDDIYQLGAVDQMYQADYVNAINTVFDGNHSGSTIAGSLTTDTAALFKPDFLAALTSDVDDGSFEIIQKLTDNGLYDWAPTVPTMLFHAKNDETVPYENTQIAHNAMTAKGASIRLETCKIAGIEVFFEATHVYCAVNYILDTVDFFLEYDPELN